MSVSKNTANKDVALSDRFMRTICAQLSENKRVWRTLPIWGRIHIDRPLPFLCVYRRPRKGFDTATDRLVTGESSYIIASGVPKFQAGLEELVRTVAQTLGDQFGAFLILELWAGKTMDDDASSPPANLKPNFRVFAPKHAELGAFTETFSRALTRIRVAKQPAEVKVVRGKRWHPARFSPLLSDSAVDQLGCSVFGLEIRPIYLNPANGGTYPLLMRELRRGLSRALRMAIFDFARTKTTHQPKHFHSLGRRAVVKAVWEVDRQLAEVSDSFDLLFQATPSNAEHAWDEFQKHDFDRTPLFHYRPLPMDPVLLKRRLFLTPINRVDDQALWHLFREKQDELDRKITMLLDINTRRFVHGSVLVFGRVEDDLMRLAKQLLDRLPPRTRDDSGSGYLDASTFARKARAEIAYYRKRWADLNASVQVRDDFVRGLMVSQGSLLVGKQVCIPTARAEALLQHEVGTHVLTYYNGCAQPLRLLRSGLAGYEALQEGLAVLAEYLVGGLNRPRLRLLAARVLAVRNLVDGASFVDTFRELTQTHRFDRRTAFTVTLRVYRGGGLTKDALYLRGLSRMFQYLREDNPLDPLFIGKIDARHIPLIQELRWRKVLKPAPLVPKYLSRPAVVARLGALREGMTVLDLIERKST